MYRYKFGNVIKLEYLGHLLALRILGIFIKKSSKITNLQLA